MQLDSRPSRCLVLDNYTSDVQGTCLACIRTPAEWLLLLKAGTSISDVECGVRMTRHCCQQTPAGGSTSIQLCHRACAGTLVMQQLWPARLQVGWARRISIRQLAQAIFVLGEFPATTNSFIRLSRTLSSVSYEPSVGAVLSRRVTCAATVEQPTSESRYDERRLAVTSHMSQLLADSFVRVPAAVSGRQPPGATVRHEMRVGFNVAHTSHLPLMSQCRAPVRVLSPACDGDGHRDTYLPVLHVARSQPTYSSGICLRPSVPFQMPPASAESQLVAAYTVSYTYAPRTARTMRGHEITGAFVSPRRANANCKRRRPVRYEQRPVGWPCCRSKSARRRSGEARDEPDEFAGYAGSDGGRPGGQCSSRTC